MTTEKVLRVVAIYRDRLRALHIIPKRMDPQKTMGELTTPELLAHAAYLVHDIEVLSEDTGRQNKMHRHFATLQAILSFVGWYRLQDLLDHNRPDTR